MPTVDYHYSEIIIVIIIKGNRQTNVNGYTYNGTVAAVPSLTQYNTILYYHSIKK